MKTSVEIGRSNWLQRASRALPIAALATLAACSGHHATKAEKPVSTVSQTQNGAPDSNNLKALYPDMSWFLQDPKTCLNGGTRPCAVLLRTEPNRDGLIVNADPTQGRVDWPLESYNGSVADDLYGVCEVAGQPVTSASPPNKYTTDKWYAVRIPLLRILNPEVKKEAKSETPPFHVVNGAADVFASAAWIQGHGNVKLPECPAVELPTSPN